MTLFHPQAAAFRTQVEQLFHPGVISFIYTPTEQLKTLSLSYTQAFLAAGCAKAFALIDQEETGIVPYLSVEANLLINGKAASLNRLAPALRNDAAFLAQSATQLNPAQSLYVQFFRGLLGDRQVILMNDFPASMDIQEIRLFLNTATAALHQGPSRLVILTADENLITAHPDTSWSEAPSLTPTTAKRGQDIIHR